MNNLSKEKKTQLMLVGLGAIVIIAVLWFLLISSQQKGLATLKKKTTETKEKFEKAEKLLKQAATIEEDLQLSAEELKAREDTMASGDHYSWFLLLMNKFIETRSLDNFGSTTPTIGEINVIPQFPYKAATFNVKLTGHYHDLGKFIAEFENHFPYMRVQNLEFTPFSSQGANSGKEEREKLDLKFEVVAAIKPGS